MRKLAGLVLTSAILVVAFGCSSSGPTASGTSSGTDGTKSGTKSLVGKWVGKIEMAKKDDAASKMAESFAGMLGDFDLDIQEGNRFTLTIMGVPTEGSVVIKDKSITLTPEKMMGKTIDELKKSEAASGKSVDNMGKPMSGVFTEDMESITLMDPEKADSKIVFKRNTEKPKVVGTPTVTSAESALVGSYKAEVDPVKVKPEEKAQMESMKAAISLKLEADNTFTLVEIVKAEGTWKVNGENVELTVAKINGNDASSKDKAEVGVFKIDGTKLTPTGKTAQSGPPISFVKE